jgi:4'-phosphopantetheinyl transferase
MFFVIGWSSGMAHSFASSGSHVFSFRLDLTLPDSMHISDPDFQLGTQLRLAEDEVHLWRIDLAAVASAEKRWQKILSVAERARAARFHFERDRQDFIATRALLRTLLASYLGAEAAELLFRYSEKEKPSLDPQASHDLLEFNVSHSGTAALLAFARGRALGVDIEIIREDFDPVALAHRFFSKHEQGQLAALDPSEKYRGFFRCWTRKEAYIKAVGTGLSLPLDQFDVSLRPADENALLATRPETSEAAEWSLREVPVGDGYVGALCVRGHGWRLQA